MSNLDTILSSLRSYLSPAQAAGVAGNLAVESKLDPTAYNPREGAIGIAQWEGARRTGPNGLQAFARARGTSETDLQTQDDFLKYELQGPESGALQRLLATNDPGNAAAAFDQYFERSSGASRATRVANAQAIAAGATPGTSSGAAMGVQSAGFLGLPSVNDVGSLVLKTGAGLIAGALVVVGVKETVR